MTASSNCPGRDLRWQAVRSVSWKLFAYAFLILLGLIMVLPFYWSLITSFKTNAEILEIPGTLWPRVFTTEHYVNLFRDMPWFSYLWNTVFVSVLGVFGNMLFGSLAAYAFAKLAFRGKKFWIKIFYASMMLPSMVLLIPQYIVCMHFPLAGGNNIIGTGGIGILESFAGIVLPGCVGVYSMLFIRQFFVSTPNDIREAAAIDGASEFRVFTMYIRMVLPGVATLGLFSFNGFWNSYLWPSIVLQDESLWLLPIALKNYNVYYSDNYGPLMAGSIIVVLPVFAVFLVTQKFFINSLATSGLKL